jgi:hypothetical protein
MGGLSVAPGSHHGRAAAAWIGGLDRRRRRRARRPGSAASAAAMTPRRRARRRRRAPPRNLLGVHPNEAVEDRAPRKKGGGIVQKSLVLDIGRDMCDSHLFQRITTHIYLHNITYGYAIYSNIQKGSGFALPFLYASLRGLRKASFLLSPLPPSHEQRP